MPKLYTFKWTINGGGEGGGRWTPGVGHSWPSVGSLNRRGWNSWTIYFKSMINSSIHLSTIFRGQICKDRIGEKGRVGWRLGTWPMAIFLIAGEGSVREGCMVRVAVSPSCWKPIVVAGWACYCWDPVQAAMWAILHSLVLHSRARRDVWPVLALIRLPVSCRFSLGSIPPPPSLPPPSSAVLKNSRNQTDTEQEQEIWLHNPSGGLAARQFWTFLLFRDKIRISARLWVEKI